MPGRVCYLACVSSYCTKIWACWGREYALIISVFAAPPNLSPKYSAQCWYQWKREIMLDPGLGNWNMTESLDLFFFFFNLFIYLFLLCSVFVSVRGLSLIAASGGHSSSRCAGLSPSRPLLLRSTGSRRAGSAIVAHGPSRSVACGIFPDQGPNPCPLHWQADSQPLRHQGSPWTYFCVVV